MPGLPGTGSEYDKQNTCPHDWEPDYNDDGEQVGSRCTMCGKYESYAAPERYPWDSEYD